MLPCGQQGIEAIERLERSRREFTKTLLDIVLPVNMNDLPNPFDGEEVTGTRDGDSEPSR
jgi:hypothetical protein